LDHTVVDVDVSRSFLEIARREADKKGIDIEYVREDMRKISFKEEFDRVY
jgi:2-polyprenyl-3-methyl-5-hydroxy-6-metoxy-1,4-benzoquinol methylase